MGAQIRATAAERELILCTLPALSVPGTVRALLEQRLALWGLAEYSRGELASDICLAADELVSNSCVATPDDQITFRAFYGDGYVSIGAWDASEQMPKLEPPNLTLETLDLGEDSFDVNGGWGLSLVMGLSSDRGVEITQPRGKWVWARFDLDPATGG